MRQSPPLLRDLVLVGGGHSHVQVLRALGMRGLPSVRVTMVSREAFTPYSGMLPGHVAGRYGWRDIHIDLGPLARFAGARLIVAEVTGLDTGGRHIELHGHPSIRYDVLSLNSGAVPVRQSAIGVAVKPIGRFLPHWQEVRERAVAGQRVALVGGGAGGIELALAMKQALPRGVEVLLLTDTLLPGHNAAAVKRLRQALQRLGVKVEESFRATGVDEGGAQPLVASDDGRRVGVDHLFWVTGVGAPDWLRGSGLATDAAGFVQFDTRLRSISHPDVFAAGDVAALQEQPRPKSGVFAVREGPVLAANLRRALLGGRLKRYRAQRQFLTIIGTGDGSAVATRGFWAVEGRWVWRWKDWIDRQFMTRFNDLPEMPPVGFVVPRTLRDEAPDAMRCGGCGAKLGADPLRRVLERLPDQSTLEMRHGVRLGIGDDAAVLRVNGGQLLLTVDGFRSIVDDPYRFGRITAHHSLNDVLAMGGQGIAALALATVPLMTDAMMEDELYLLLKGAIDVLNEHGVPLVGGHSAEGAELSLALSITGVEQGAALTKQGLRPGDALVLNKPLGTGALLAADMRGRAPSDHVAAALACMDHSNAPALEVLRAHDVRALTDVTGFGLLGHLGEMLRASGVGAMVCVGQVPLLPGARDLVDVGIVSSLQTNNEAVLRDFGLSAAAGGAIDSRVRLLVDPQTSGGLLAGVPADRAEACVAALRAAGFGEAARVGVVTADTWQVVVR
jgi:selenide, water dikinase